MSAPYAYQAPLIVSQNEIEAIGLDPASRREILDRLVDPVVWEELQASPSRAQIASIERRLERLRQDRDSVVERVLASQGLREQLTQAEAEQLAATQKASDAEPLRDRIAKQADELGRMRSAADAYKITENTLARWRQELEESRLPRPLPTLPAEDHDAAVKSAVAHSRKLVKDAVEGIKGAEKIAVNARTDALEQQGTLQASLKTDTQRLDELQAGAGELSRRVSTLRQQIREQEGLAQRVAELDRELASVSAEREDALDAREAEAEQRYRLRKERAAVLTADFNGRIEVRVDKSGAFEGYQATLVSLLQGSGLQYKALASGIAQTMSPRELVRAIEADDPEPVETAASVSTERAVRLIAHLGQQSNAELLLAPLDDSVDFALLDGQDYKVTSHLSMGQRCTVVLPLLLAEPRDAILLDQPEDHLDNAFIVETLVEAIGERARSGQVIVATHNANIPVLGDAALVVVMASDGRRGFVVNAAELDDDATVRAITTLMEGGREAFQRRATFYGEHDDVG